MLRALGLLAVLVDLAQGYSNVKGSELRRCSHAGMALTGWTRNGHCVDYNDDGGSHHICLDLSSTSSSGDNFCAVTGQSNWCGSRMRCDDNPHTECPVEHWCVCQWAFSSYIERAGGCASIQNIVCDATNMAALTAYRASAASDSKIKRALECLESRCLSDLASTNKTESDRTEMGTEGATANVNSEDGVAFGSEKSDAAHGVNNNGNLVGLVLGALLIVGMVGGAVAIYYHQHRGNTPGVGSLSQSYAELEHTTLDAA